MGRRGWASGHLFLVALLRILLIAAILAAVLPLPIVEALDPPLITFSAASTERFLRPPARAWAAFPPEKPFALILSPSDTVPLAFSSLARAVFFALVLAPLDAPLLFPPLLLPPPLLPPPPPLANLPRESRL